MIETVTKVWRGYRLEIDGEPVGWLYRQVISFRAYGGNRNVKVWRFEFADGGKIKEMPARYHNTITTEGNWGWEFATPEEAKRWAENLVERG